MRVSTTILLVIATCLPTRPALAQNSWLDSLKYTAASAKPDSEKVWVLKTIADYYVWNAPDSAIFFAKSALALAEKQHYDLGIFWSIQSLHNALHITGNYTEQLNYALKAMPIAGRLHDWYAYGWSNGMMADTYISLGDYETAMTYIRVVMQNISARYPNELYSGYAVIVPVYIGLRHLDSAMLSAQKALDLLKQQPTLYNGTTDDAKNAHSLVYLNLGRAYAAQDKYDSALWYYRASLPYSIQMNMKINLLDAYTGMANVFNKRGLTDSAITYSKLTLSDKLAASYISVKLASTRLLADAYEQQHRWDSSLRYLRQTANLTDSLYSREKTSAFQNMLLKEQEKQKDIAAATAALKNRYIIYSLIILFAALAVIAGVVLRNRRIKQLQHIRNTIADDLHDDIGSALSSISIMNEMAKSTSPRALELLNSISESTAGIQENMSDIVWTVNPSNDRFSELIQRMKLFASEITEPKDIQLQFHCDELLGMERLEMKQRKNLYLFFKEAVNNAVKHSGASQLNVDIIKRYGYIEMTIADNGSGFNTAGNYDGNGLNSMRRRATELHGLVNVRSAPGTGTCIFLKFKVA